MHIHSKFHDYYDSARGHGQDPLLHYVRETREIDGNLSPMVPYFEHGLNEKWARRWASYEDRKIVEPYTTKLSFVFFCGKVYPVYSFRATYLDKEIFCYTEEAVQKFFAESETGIRNRFYPSASPRARKTTFDKTGTTFNAILDLHRLTGSPAVFVHRPSERYEFETVVNPVLADLSFASVVDPYTAFQEISMFLGGVLGSPGKEADPISDELKRDTHGFDDRSFKMDSPGKKTRRRSK